MDFVRHDQHCQPANYMKLISVTIRRQSCQILNTLDEFQQSIHESMSKRKRTGRRTYMLCDNDKYVLI